MSIEFQVKKKNLTENRIIEREEQPLGDGEIRLKVDLFSFTANNITYGAAGYSLGYWQFFPASNNDDDSWGIIPVWAFADVVESNCADIPTGERLYGYFPPATNLTMAPKDITAQTLIDGTEHLQVLPPLYNRYRRVQAEPGYDKATDAARVLLAPLHITSFCLWDQLAENNYYNAEQVIIVSASSKTSLGLAHGLANDENSPTLVGLTSERNKEFVSGLGLYDEVVSYEALTEQLAEKTSVVVDMAGNATVKNSLQQKLADNLLYFISVGITHWDELGDSGGFSTTPNPAKEENFFAPSYILERAKELGPGEFDKRSINFVRAAAMATFGWMNEEKLDGLQDLAKIYPDICEGTVSPSSGLVVRM